MGVGVYIPNMSKPKNCSECILADKHLNGLYEAKYYCRLEADSCPLIEIDLVRCGECKHSKEWYADRCLCYLWAEEGVSVFEDGYCSYGEREGK